MNEDIYVKLCERLNQNEIKLPPVNSVLALLRELFTEKQAKLAAEMPLGAHTIKSLAAQLNRDEGQLEKMLETLADEGLIFVAKNENNEREYSVPPFAPGILELQYLKGEETEKAIKRYDLMEKMHEELETMSDEVYKNVEAANKNMGSQGLRTLAIEEELPGNTQITTWEKISEMIDRLDSFAVGTCACRLGARMKGDPCKIDGAPEQACVYFGKVADFIVDRNFGKRITKKELFDLLKVCEEKGLIHNITNVSGDNILLCNCCGCCCQIMRPMLKFPGLKSIAGSNFMAVVDAETCTGCEECVTRCQVKAIEMEAGIAKVNPDYCIGCGVCVSQCPSESLSLVRCSDYKPPKQSDAIVGFGV